MVQASCRQQQGGQGLLGAALIQGLVDEADGKDLWKGQRVAEGPGVRLRHRAAHGGPSSLQTPLTVGLFLDLRVDPAHGGLQLGPAQEGPVQAARLSQSDQRVKVTGGRWAMHVSARGQGTSETSPFWSSCSPRLCSGPLCWLLPDLERGCRQAQPSPLPTLQWGASNTSANDPPAHVQPSVPLRVRVNAWHRM